MIEGEDKIIMPQGSPLDMGEIEKAKELVKHSLYWHTRYVHGFSMPKHQKRWARVLQDDRYDRIIIVAPPKYGKSPTLVDYIGWKIGKDTEGYHCIYLSSTARQANKYSVALRDTVDLNDNYKLLYDVKPDKNKGWGESEWFVKRKDQADKDPTVQSCGIGGPILGATVQELFFDDIADEENMTTEYQREKLMDWVKSTPMSRLVPGKSRAVMTCTRWHESDPAAQFKEQGWKVFDMSALDENGESTYPTFWTIPELEKRKVDLGTRKFELMFQNNVLPAEGAIFKREYWRYWKQGEAPWQITGDGYQPIIDIVQSWDTAHKAKKENDYSACETWAVVKSGFYLLNAWRGKLTYPQLKIAFQQLYDQFKPHYVLIEDAASGQDLIMDMRVSTTVPIVAIQVDKDKVSRANTSVAQVEAGNVFIPEEASWRQNWEYEHEIFPTGKNDDWVDTTTQFLNWARTHVTTGPSSPVGVSQTSRWR